MLTHLLALVLLLLPAGVSLAVFGYAWRQRGLSGRTPFLVLCVTAVVWIVGNALELTGTTLATKVFWMNVQYACYATIPVAYLVLTLEFLGHGRWLNRARLGMLLLIPALTALLVWIHPTLIHRSMHLAYAGYFSVIVRTFGPWYWVHFAYSYLLFLTTIALLVVSLLRAHSLYRWQMLVLLFGLVLPLAFSCLYSFGLGPLPQYDLSPLVVGLSGAVIAWGLSNLRLLDIVPVARSRVIESMNDGMIVLDAADRIVDINPAAAGLLGCSPAGAIGRPLAQATQGWPAFFEAYQRTEGNQVEFVREEGETRSDYELRISAMTDRRGQAVGWVLLLHDITERKRAEAYMRHMAYHDPLTGLPNRRLFSERLAHEIARARRSKRHLVVMMLDLDHFKDINDTRGHEIGDQVLCAVAGRLRVAVREADTVARFGGDEFTVLQTEVGSTEDALALAHRILDAFASPIRVTKANFPLSISIGISLFPDDALTAEALVTCADDAMYLAKRTGGGRCVFFSEMNVLATAPETVLAGEE